MASALVIPKEERSESGWRGRRGEGLDETAVTAVRRTSFDVSPKCARSVQACMIVREVAQAPGRAPIMSCHGAGLADGGWDGILHHRPHVRALVFMAIRSSYSAVGGMSSARLPRTGRYQPFAASVLRSCWG